MRCARLSRDSNDTLVTCTVLARFSAARSLAHISIRAELFMIQPSRQYPIKIINTEYAVKNTVKLLNLNSLNGVEPNHPWINWIGSPDADPVSLCKL